MDKLNLYCYYMMKKMCHHYLNLKNHLAFVSVFGSYCHFVFGVLFVIDVL